MLRHTALAASAMFASQRRSNHACNTEIGLIKLPRGQQLINHSPLLRNAVQFRDESGVKSHAGRIKKRRETEKRSKDEVQQQMRAVAANGTPRNGSQPVGADEEEGPGKYASHPGLRD